MGAPVFGSRRTPYTPKIGQEGLDPCTIESRSTSGRRGGFLRAILHGIEVQPISIRRTASSARVSEPRDRSCA